MPPALLPTSHDVAARGARIRFVEAGSGAPLILLHDYLASRVVWDDVLPGLAQRFRVIAPDLPGFGESEKPPPGRYRYDFEAFSESLVDLIAAVGLGRVSLCGHALGGAIALTVAATHADLVDKLILVNPLVYPPRPDAVTRIAGVPVIGPLLFKQLYGRTLFRSRFLGSERPDARLRHDERDARHPAAHGERAEGESPCDGGVGQGQPLVALRARAPARARARGGALRGVRLRVVAGRGSPRGFREGGHLFPRRRPGVSPTEGQPAGGRRFTANGAIRAGAAVLALIVGLCVVGPWVARHGPLESDFVRGVGSGGAPVGPCREFPLGADRLFRDVFARLVSAGRLSLAIAAGATAVASALGTTVGLVAGWYASGRARVVDEVLMRAVDVLLALPFLLLVMAIGASLRQTSALTILVTLGLTGWLGLARVVRAKTLQVCSLDYVAASRALGQSPLLLVVRHVVPNVAGVIVVTATTQMAQMVVADSALGYLGAGIAPPTATWGRMLAEGQDYYLAAPWLVAAPGAAIFLAVWGINMLGEGLRDALDPHER